MNDVTDYINKEAELYVNTAQELTTLSNKLKENNYTAPAEKNPSAYTTEVYSLAEIQAEINKVLGYSKEFTESFQQIESSKFGYDLAAVIVIPILVVLALVCKLNLFKLGYKLKQGKLVLVISLILYAWVIPAAVVVGLSMSNFLMSIDLCQDVYKYVKTDAKPIADRGISYYISCPSKPTLTMINTAKYLLGNSFNEVAQETNATLTQFNNTNLGPYKRNNSNFEHILSLNFNGTSENLKKGISSLVMTNELLLDLEILASCKFAKSSINYLEEKFCYRSMDYQFNNLIFSSCVIVGLLLLSVGINKLIVLLNPKFHVAQVNIEKF